MPLEASVMWPSKTYDIFDFTLQEENLIELSFWYNFLLRREIKVFDGLVMI